MASMTDFGLRIDQAQKEKAISNTELAKKLKVSAPQVFSLKHKTKNPRGATLTKVAKALGKTEDFFLTGKSEKPKVIIRRPAIPAQDNLAAFDSDHHQYDLETSTKNEPKIDFDQHFPMEEIPSVSENVVSALVEAPTKAIAAKAAKRRGKEEETSAVTPEASTEGLRAYVIFEYQGKVIAKKPLHKLPMEFEL